jgi:hypothetical protein
MTTFLFAPFFIASAKPRFNAVGRTSPLEFLAMEQARRWNSLSERSAKHRQGETQRSADSGQPPGNHGIVNLSAVPGEQEIHPMHAGEGDVGRVARRARRNQTSRENPTSQCLDVVGHRQDWQVGDGLKTQPGGLGISLRGLVQHKTTDHWTTDHGPQDQAGKAETLTRRNLKPAKFLGQRTWVHLWFVNQPLEPTASQFGKSALPRSGTWALTMPRPSGTCAGNSARLKRCWMMRWPSSYRVCGPIEGEVTN